MFTGIIEEVGTVKSLTVKGENQSELCVTASLIQSDLKLGDSVAVDGVCLTAINFNKTEARFELSSETLKTTLFSRKKQGAKVNLERALRLGDRLGGHLALGHVDCLGQVLEIKQQGEFYEMSFALEPEIQKYVVYKGSIAINGVSLTIAELTENSFSAAVIPHTFQHTSLSALRARDKVHLESDIIARYIEGLITDNTDKSQPEKSNLNLDFLQKHGF